MSMRRAASAALTAVFALMSSPAAAEKAALPRPDDVTMEDVAEMTDIIELQNAQGQTSKIAIIYNERYNIYWQKKMRTKIADDMHENPNDLDIPLYRYLSAQGFKDALNFSMDISQQYSPSSGYKADAPFPFQRPHLLHDKENFFKTPTALYYFTEEDIPKAGTEPRSQCAVILLPAVYDGQTWTRSFLALDDSPRAIKLMREYGRDFVDFVLYHELAHCMGGDETMADYIASKMLLKESKNKLKTLDFLKLIKSIRSASLFTILPVYQETSIAINHAIQEFRKNRFKVPETREQIWLMATQPKDFNGWPMSFVKAEVVARRSDLVANKDFNGIVQHLIDNMASLPEARRRELAFEIIRDLRRLSHIIEKVPESSKQAPVIHIAPK